MGVIKGVLVVVFSVLLFASLLIMNFSLTLGLSLEYENVEEEIKDAINESIDEQIDGFVGDIDLDKEFEKIEPEIEEYCQNHTEFILSEEGQNLSISCGVALEGKDAIFEEVVETAVETVYYEEYDCSFWDCLKEKGPPFFLVSEKAKNYWEGNFTLFLFISLAFATLLFIFVERKHNAFVILGILLVLTSLPFLGIGYLSFFSIKSNLLDFVKISFSKSQSVFVISLVSGIVFLSAGILLKLFGVGFKISSWIDKFKKSKGNSNQKPSEVSQKIKS